MTKAFGTVSDDSKYRYRQGLGNAAAYQVSGHPYITGSTSLDNNRQVQILFPQVAKSVTVINRADVELWVHFNDANLHASSDSDDPASDHNYNENVFNGKHYISLDNKKDSVTFDVKCKEIYITNTSGQAAGAFQVLAELTSVHPNDMYALTGSGLTDVDAVENFRQKTIS